MSANSAIVGSFVQLTNFFASKFGTKCASISSLTELWEKQGTMIANMMQCDIHDFKSSDLFYEVLHRKFRIWNGSLAEALDPKKAASDDLLEICKFYMLYLEFLRKDHSGMLTNVLEKLETETDFKSSILLEIFKYFDTLYSEDTVDDWWSCLLITENPEATSGFETPTRNNFSSMNFSTPIMSAKRFRQTPSTVRRSPIAEAVDSPTMKFMRSERELKQIKKRLLEMEQYVEDVDVKNRELTDKNRELKLMIDGLKGDVASKRDAAENAELRMEEISTNLEAKTIEISVLTQQLNEARTTLRAEQRHLEELEEEKDKLVFQMEKSSEDKRVLLKQMRELRDINENEFANFQKKEKELLQNFRALVSQNADITEQLKEMEEIKSVLQSENEHLTGKLDDLNLLLGKSSKDFENVVALQKEERKRHQMTVENLQQEKSDLVQRLNLRNESLQEENAGRIKIAESIIERLEKELQEERNYRQSLDALLSDMSQKAFHNDKENHEKSQDVHSARACFESVKLQNEQLQIQISVQKNEIAFLKQQIERAAEILLTEKDIREQVALQQAHKEGLLKETIEKLQNELESVKENLRNVVMKHHDETQLLKNELEIAVDKHERLEIDYEKLRAKQEIVDQRNCFLGERIRLLEEEYRDEIRIRAESPESLADFLAKNGGNSTEEELRKLAAKTPRKSVTFHSEMNGSETRNETPIGFNAMNTRESMSSFDFLDRSSTARSSMRSETLTLASASSIGEFKQPFSPSGTSKDRISVLTSRNEKVRPHLQCSYASEMGDVNSPSANEENLKKGSNTKEAVKPKKRRDSIFSFRNKK